MQVVFYNFDKKINSTAQPSGGTSYDVDLLNECSILEPVLIMRTTSDNIRNKWNYAYIADFGRYYFINNVVIINKNESEVYLKCDPLASFKSNITSYTGIVARSSTDYDITIVDPMINSSSKVASEHFMWSDVKKGPYGNQGSDAFNFPTSLSATWQTIGKDGTAIFNVQQIPNQTVSALLNGSGQWEFGITNPGQYISSCIILPFKYDSYSDSASIPIGNLSASIGTNYKSIDPLASDSVQELSFKFTKSQIEAKLNYGVGDFRNYIEKFTKAKIWAPFVGIIDIPVLHLKADFIVGSYSISTLNGCGKFILRAIYLHTDSTIDEYVIMSSNINMSFDIPISAGHTDNKAIINDVLSAISTVGDLINTGISVGMSGFSKAGDILKASASGASEALSLFSDYASGFQEYTCLGTSGSLAEMGSDFIQAGLAIIQMDTITEDIVHECGRSKMSYEQIGNNQRFIQMQNASLDISKATLEEKTAVNTYLNSGVYIE